MPQEKESGDIDLNQEKKHCAYNDLLDYIDSLIIWRPLRGFVFKALKNPPVLRAFT